MAIVQHLKTDIVSNCMCTVFLYYIGALYNLPDHLQAVKWYYNGTIAVLPRHYSGNRSKVKLLSWPQYTVPDILKSMSSESNQSLSWPHVDKLTHDIQFGNLTCPCIVLQCQVTCNTMVVPFQLLFCERGKTRKSRVGKFEFYMLF